MKERDKSLTATITKKCSCFSKSDTCEESVWILNPLIYSPDWDNMEVYTFGSMVPMGGGSNGLVKLRRGWVGRTQAVGMVRLPPACASSAAAEEGAPGTGPTGGTSSPGGAEEPGSRGAGCWAAGCCWRRGLLVASDDRARNERSGIRMDAVVSCSNDLLRDEDQGSKKSSSDELNRLFFLWTPP